MKRRAFFALLPLPWLKRWLPVRAQYPRIWSNVWAEPGVLTEEALRRKMAISTFVCRKPDGVMLLRENMR